MDHEIAALKRKQEKIDRLLSGDPLTHEDGLETRLHLNERKTHKLEVVLLGEEGTHRGGLMEELRQEIQSLRADIANLRFDLKQIADDKSIKVQVRRDWLTFWAAIIGVGGLLFTNVGPIAHGIEAVVRMVRPRPLTAEEIKKEIAELKKERGPEVKKKLKELEAARRRLELDAD